MRAFKSHEDAKHRLEEGRRDHNRLELDALLRYLEDLSPEPSGEEAYGLSLCLRSMSLPVDNLFALLGEAQDRLQSFRNLDPEHDSVREKLDKIARCLEAKLRQKGEEKNENKTGNPSQQPPSGPNWTEDPEFRAACNRGDAISRSFRYHYKLRLFHNMVALALYWTCFKPSSEPSREATPWIEEDIIRLFP